MQIFSYGAEKELDKEIAHELAVGIGKVLESATEAEYKDLVEAINTVMTNSAKRDKKYAEYVVEYLKTLYPKIHHRYNFKINKI